MYIIRWSNADLWISLLMYSLSRGKWQQGDIGQSLSWALSSLDVFIGHVALKQCVYRLIAPSHDIALSIFVLLNCSSASDLCRSAGRETGTWPDAAHVLARVTTDLFVRLLPICRYLATLIAIVYVLNLLRVEICHQAIWRILSALG